MNKPYHQRVVNTKYRIVSINLGHQNDLTVEIYKTLIKKHGQNHFSALIRELLLTNFSDRKEYEEARKSLKIKAYKRLKREAANYMRNKARMKQQLIDEGIDPEEII